MNLARKSFFQQLKDGDFQMVAASLSFSTALSLIPFFAVTLGILQAIDALDDIYPKVEAILLTSFQGATGIEGTALLRKIFSRIQYGKLGPVGAGALLLTSALLLTEMEKAIHRVWNIPNKRPLIRRWFVNWLILLLWPFLLALLVALASAKMIQGNIPIAFFQVLGIFGSFLLIYKLVPNTKVPWLSAIAGALTASLGLWGLTASFKGLSQIAFAYNKVYGSLAAIPTLLIWILLFWYVVLVGAAVSSSVKRSV